MKRTAKITLIVSVCIFALTLPGCHPPPPPGPAINYYIGPPQELSKIRRIAFVELTGEQNDTETARNMSGALFRAIQGRNLFHLALFDRTDPVCLDLPLNRRGPHTIEQLAQLRDTLQCNAILYGWVNHQQPYPRIQIGLHLRLLDLQAGKLLWGVDNIWDSTNQQTELRIKKFFEDHMRTTGYEPIDWRLAMLSPAVFQKFVAYEVAQTLPARNTDAQQEKPQRSATARRTLAKLSKTLGKL